MRLKSGERGGEGDEVKGGRRGEDKVRGRGGGPADMMPVEKLKKSTK